MSLLFSVQCAQPAFAQQDGAEQNPLQRHYGAAEERIRAGDEIGAATEYRAFLVEALRHIGQAQANAGGFAAAAPRFDDAIALAPDDISLHLDFARACFSAMQYLRAKQLAEQAVQLDPQNVEARLQLGQVLYQLGDYQNSKTKLESVFASDPNPNLGYLLGTNYLLLGDAKSARAIFDQMLRKWGNTAFNHTLIGRAYSQTGHPEDAFAEFHKALEIDSHALQVHYQMGLAYLLRNESTGFDKAITELLAELKLNPKDFPSHYTLGYIAVRQRRWADAEKYLLEAVALDPTDRQTLLDLSDTYVATKRPTEAETTLRKILEIGKDMPPDHWTERAHYLLGRVLLSQPGHSEDAKHEMSIVASLQRQLGPAAARTAQENALETEAHEQQEKLLAAADSAKTATAASLGQLQEFIQRISPAIGSAYNNLGVVARNQRDSVASLKYFRKAKEWNPEIEGLNRNLGMEAFFTNQYREAVDPLRQHLQDKPDDVAARAALGFSLFNTQDFQGTVEALQPMLDQLSSRPKLAFVYAVSLVYTGKYDEGIDRLKSLEIASPNAPDVHHELALAYQHQGRSKDAVREMKIYEDLQAQASGHQPSPTR